MTTSPKVSKCRSAGFTLIEVAVALTVFFLAVAALSALLTSTIQSNDRARHLSTAANLAQWKVEELRNLSWASVTSGVDAQPLTATGASGGLYTRRWTVSEGPEADTKRVVVRVTWEDRGGHDVELETLIAK